MTIYGITAEELHERIIQRLADKMDHLGLGKIKQEMGLIR